MPLNYEILVSFSIVFQIIFFIAAISLVGRLRKPGFYALLAVAVSFLLGKTNDIWQQTGLILQHPDWIFTVILVAILQGPFIYLYVRARTEASFRPRWSHLVHCGWILLPAAYLAVYWWPYGTQEKIELLTSGGLENLTTLVLLPVYFDGILVFYLAASVARLRSHGIQLQNWFSNIEDRNLSGIRYLLTMFALMVVAHLLWTLGRYFFWQDVVSAWFGNLLVTYHLVLINGLFLEFVTYRYSPGEQGTLAMDTARGSSGPPAGLSPSEQQRLIADLNGLLQKERLYLDPNLTVADLAKPLRIHARTLSQLINQHQACNFYEFINRHRIEHAKAEIAADPAKSILQVAYDSGFNSKSAFNTAFKRFVQLTPTGFRRSLAENTG